MNGLWLEAIAGGAAQAWVERVLNSLPEGLLIAFFVWALLRVLRRQNSGTRFAVWFLALLAVAALPFLCALGERPRSPAAGMAWGHLHPAISIPGSWAVFAFVAWAVGAAIALVRLGMGVWRLRQLRLSCVPVAAADLDPAVRRTVEALGPAVTVAISEQVRVPSAIGFWKRTIILPAWTLVELPASDLSAILLHEFAHLRRWDGWTNLIQKIVRAVFFFHPAVWWIEKRLSVEREMACDDAVLAETSNPHGYASCLVSLLEKSLEHRQWAMAQAAVRRAREASLRLTQILDANRPAATRVWKPALVAAAVLFAMCLAAVPDAPQFVAFDRGAGDAAITGGSARGGQRDFATVAPMMVPASFHPDSVMAAESAGRTPGIRNLSARKTRNSTAAKISGVGIIPAAVAANKGMTPPPVAGEPVLARAGETSPQAQIFEVGADAANVIVPQVQTLVFVEATEYRSGNSPVWSVQLWRVTFVSGVRGRVVKVPVASTI